MVRLLFLAGATGVVVWRAVALWQAEDFWFALVLGFVGIAFLVAAVDTFVRPRIAQSVLIAAYLMCQSLHWGGPIHFESQNLTYVPYLLVSGTFAQAFLLHTALSMTRAKTQSWQLMAVYLPVSCFVLYAVATLLSLSALQSFWVGHTVLDNLYGVVALIILLTKAGAPRWLGCALLSIWITPILAELVNTFILTVNIASRGVEPVNVIYTLIPIAFYYLQTESFNSRRQTITR